MDNTPDLGRAMGDSAARENMLANRSRMDKIEERQDRLEAVLTELIRNRAATPPPVRNDIYCETCGSSGPVPCAWCAEAWQKHVRQIRGR